MLSQMKLNLPDLAWNMGGGWAILLLVQLLAWNFGVDISVTGVFNHMADCYLSLSAICRSDMEQAGKGRKQLTDVRPRQLQLWCTATGMSTWRQNRLCYRGCTQALHKVSPGPIIEGDFTHGPLLESCLTGTNAVHPKDYFCQIPGWRCLSKNWMKQPCTLAYGED